VGRKVSVDRAALKQHRAAPCSTRMAVQAEPDCREPFVGAEADESPADRNVLMARQAAAGGKERHGSAIVIVMAHKAT